METLNSMHERIIMIFKSSMLSFPGPVSLTFVHKAFNECWIS